MSPTEWGLAILFALLALLFLGVPVAFALGAVAMVALVLAEGPLFSPGWPSSGWPRCRCSS